MPATPLFEILHDAELLETVETSAAIEANLINRLDPRSRVQSIASHLDEAEILRALLAGVVAPGDTTEAVEAAREFLAVSTDSPVLRLLSERASNPPEPQNGSSTLDLIA